jgi:hypothetical protein
MKCSCGEQVKLLGERRPPMAGVLRLLLAHHVDHLDLAQDHTSSAGGSEAEHGPNPPFDSTMILLNPIVQIGTSADLDRLLFTPRFFPELICHVTGQDRFTVGLASVNHDPLGSTVPLERLAQEALVRGEVAPLTEPELDGAAGAVDGPVEIDPTPADFDIRLIDMPFAADGTFAPIEPLQEL